jgi:hypothetical protein
LKITLVIFNTDKVLDGIFHNPKSALTAHFPSKNPLALEITDEIVDQITIKKSRKPVSDSIGIQNLFKKKT